MILLKKNNLQKKNNNIIVMPLLRLLAGIAMILLLGISFITNNNVFSLLAVFVLAGIIFTGSPTEDFYAYIFLIPFSGFITFGSRNIIFVFLLISIVKILIKTKPNLLLLNWLAAFGFIMIVELSFDFTGISIGIFIYLIALLLYFFIFIGFYNFENLDPARIVTILIITCVTVISFIIIASGGNLAMYANSENTQLRLGEAARELGGAMEIPLYCMIIFCCGFVSLLKFKMNIILKIIIAALMVAAIYIGLLSLSRVFLLGIGAFLFYLLFLILKEEKKSKLLISVAIIIALIAGYLYFNIDTVMLSLEKMFERSTQGSDISTGRFTVWSDCFKYNASYPSSIIFGSGAGSYVKIGEEMDYAFKSMAHNIAIDAYMSWGLPGLMAIIYSVLLLFKRCGTVLKTNFDFVGFTPFFVWFVMNMTGGTFNYYKTYFYILTLVVLSMLFVKKSIMYEPKLGKHKAKIKFVR